ncbi:protein kinase [Lentisphaera profundi]|uniref:Protein kinase n=1 Tax=Lentisphaera profundi TaxID=1658616 RepID=A0ABY7VX41_9BACT|nr:protein kinase [Lentisphaera profundi]WDE97765.1 protein kinase [Lentisphaera profundi]
MNSSKEPSLEDNFTQSIDFLKESLMEVHEEESQEGKTYTNILTLLPQSFKNYRDINLFDEGGMKVIEKAWDPSGNREVAIASMKTDSEDLKQKILFINEAWTTGRMEHPNIVPVYEVAINDQQAPYFSMKMLRGMNLQDWLKKQSESAQKQSIPSLLEIFKKIIDAVAYAHSKGVVHLDLKPANIHVGEFGEILLIDWGLARVFNASLLSEQQLKLHEAIEPYLQSHSRGTPDYMAPESRDGTSPSPQADIYSLGIILRCLLTSAMPQSEAFDNLKKVPKSIQSIIGKSSATNLEVRYKTVESLNNDINSYLDGFANSAESPSTITHLQFFIKRHKQLCLFGLIASFIILTLTLYSFSEIKGSEAIALEETERTKQALADLQLETLEKDKLIKKLEPGILIEQRRYVNDLDFSEALRSMEFLMRMDSKDPEILFRYARLKFATLEFEKAQEVFIEVQKQDPNYPDIAHFLEASDHFLKLSQQRELNDDDYLNLASNVKQGTVALALFEKVYSTKNIHEQIEFFKKFMASKFSKQVYSIQILDNQNLEIKLKTASKSLNILCGLPVENLYLGPNSQVQSSLNHLTKLKKLSIYNGKVNTLKTTRNLIELIIEQSETSPSLSISPQDHPLLKTFSLRGSNLNKWPIFQNFPHLESLDLRETNFEKFSSLLHSNSLKTIYLTGPIPEDHLKRLNKRKDIEIIIE